MRIQSRFVTAALCLLAVVALLHPSSAMAQTGAASLTGIVTDQSGATVPGATVTATNQATNVTYTAVSNQAGNYTVTSLPVGTYVVKAELSSFKTAATKPIQLEAMQIARIDFKLELGALQETVEVSSDAQVLQTESAVVGEVISGSTLSALPLNGRNTGQLSLLLPGVVTPNPGSFTAIRNFTGGRPFVNGNREQTNNYTIDGVDMNESIDNTVAYQPSPDALAEISVETNNYAADTGNVAGAVISNVIKSGSNSFHGNAFEFYRNSDMDANSWSNNRSSAAKPERRQDIFGGTFGGPIVKNKLFFFGNYQGTQFDAPGFETISVAPATWRAGDLSSITTVIRDPSTGAAFSGNQIPIGRISPIARSILTDLSLYPLPNRVVSGVTGNFVGETLQTISANQADVRIDWNLSADDKIFGRYSFAEYEQRTDKRAIPLLLGSLQEAPFRNLALNWNRIISPTLVNEVLFGYNQITVVGDTLDWSGIGNANATFGIAGGQPIAGLSSIGWGNGLSNRGRGRDRYRHPRQDVSNQREADLAQGPSHHQERRAVPALRAATVLRWQQRVARPVWLRRCVQRIAVCRLPARSGIEQGSRQPVGSLDAPAQPSRAVRPGRLQAHLGAHAQPRHAVGVHAAHRREGQPSVQFQLGTGQQILAQDGDRESRALYKSYMKGFEPRLGFAYRGGDRWVFRGGYGITQYMEGTGANLRLPLNPPYFFESQVNYDTTTGPGTLATGFAELRPLDQPSGQVRAWDPNLRPQFTQQWNVFAEYLLTPTMSANIGYVGHNADHLVTPVEGNQPLAGAGSDTTTWLPAQQRRPLYATAPLITNISTTAARGRSDYNALQVSLRQRFMHGLEYLASYTLGSVKTNNLGYYGSGGVAAEGAYWMNTYEPEWNYGPAFFDVRHNLVFSANYELPYGRGRTYGSNVSPLVDAILGGWRVSGIFQARTGFPITVTDGANRSLQGQRGNERPNCIGDPVPSDQNINHWLDINAFQRVPLGTWGNCGIGVARAPGYKNLDFVLAKKFSLGGTRAFEFRAEAFNLTNTPSFGPPARNINSPNDFGQITSTVSTARTMELVFKFFF